MPKILYHRTSYHCGLMESKEEKTGAKFCLAITSTGYGTKAAAGGDVTITSPPELSGGVRFEENLLRGFACLFLASQ